MKDLHLRLLAELSLSKRLPYCSANLPFELFCIAYGIYLVGDVSTTLRTFVSNVVRAVLIFHHPYRCLVAWAYYIHMYSVLGGRARIQFYVNPRHPARYFFILLQRLALQRHYKRV